MPEPKPPSAAAKTAAALAMNVKVLAALAVILLLAAAWTLLPLGEAESGTVPALSVESTGASAPAAGEVAHGVEVGASEGREALAVDAVGIAATEPTAPLNPERDLLVRVIDADGEPVVGEPVIVVHGRPAGRERWWLSATSEAPDGIARFVDYLGKQENERNEQGLAKFVGLDIVGFDPPRVALPSSGLPAEVPTLRVPPHAELLVRLVDQGGEAFPTSDWIHVTPLRSAGTASAGAERGDRASIYIEEASETRIPRVAPGTRLWVQVTPLGILADAEQVVPPLAAGERRTVELVMGATEAHVVGRVVHPDGSTVPARYLDVDLEPGRSVRVYGLGADGSFALPLDSLPIKEGFFVGNIAVSLRAPGAARSAVQKLTGTFQAVVPSDGGAHNVGNVILRPPPTIAAGRVTDTSGAPVEDVAITLYEKFNQREDPEDFGWNYVGVGIAYSDAEGRFDMKGTVDPGEYALRVQFSDWIDRGAHRFQAGARGIELVIDKKRTIVGQLLLPDGVDPALLEVRAHEEGASRERRAYMDWRTTADSAGNFTLLALRPEPVTVSVHLPGLPDPIAEIRGVQPRLDAGESIAQLNPWDLSRDVAGLSFDVRLADGKPMGSGFVALGGHVLAHREGRVSTVAPSAWGNELQVFAPGHVPALVAVTDDLTRVDLMRGPRVVVSLNAPLPEPPEGVFIEVSLEPEEPAWALPASAAYTPFTSTSRLGSDPIRCRPGDTSWELYGAGPGNYRPRWSLIRPGESPVDGARTVPLVNRGGRYEIVLGQGSRATRYVAEFDRDDWSAAMSRLTGERR